MSTDGWNDQKDIFLNGLDALIKGLKKPDLVQRAEFERAQGQYKRALDTINAKDGKIGKLNAQIAELKKCKDGAQVEAVTAKYSTSEQQFSKLQQQAQNALKRLERATRVTLYWDMMGEHYSAKGDDEWNEVETAKAENEVTIYQGEDACAVLNEENSRVATAKQALNELNDFLNNDKQREFVDDMTEKLQFPIKLSNKEFWRNFLINVG